MDDEITFDDLERANSSRVDDIVNDMKEHPIKWTGFGITLGAALFAMYLYMSGKGDSSFGGMFQNKLSGVFDKLGMKQSGRNSEAQFREIVGDGSPYWEKYNKLDDTQKEFFLNHPFVSGLIDMDRDVENFTETTNKNLDKVFEAMSKSDPKKFVYNQYVIEKLPDWNNMVVSPKVKKDLKRFTEELIKGGASGEFGGIFAGRVEGGNLYIEDAIPILNDEDIEDGVLTSRYKFSDQDFYKNVFLSKLRGKNLVGTWHIHPPAIGGWKFPNTVKIAGTPDKLPSKADRAAWQKSVDQYNQPSAIVDVPHVGKDMSPEERKANQDMRGIYFYKNQQFFEKMPMEFSIKE